MVVGLLISYGILLPTLTWGDLPAGADVSDVVSSTFGTEVRFVGAGRDRGGGGLDAAEDPRPDRARHPGRRGVEPGPARRRHGRADRAGPADRHRRWDDRGRPDPDRRAAVGLPVGHTDRRPHRVDGRGQPGLHRGARRGDRGRRRVHGRTHRLVQQPHLRGGHPRRAGHRPAAGRAARARRRPGPHHRAGRLRAVHHGGGVLGRHHLQRQPAGPQDRPAGRRDTVEAAGRAGHRGGLRISW